MSNGHNGFPMATPIAFRTSGKYALLNRTWILYFINIQSLDNLSYVLELLTHWQVIQLMFPVLIISPSYIVAADLSNYHYPGRTRGYQGNILGGGGPVSSPITGGVTTGPHRPTVFRTGWE